MSPSPELLEHYQKNPVAFFEQVLGAKLEDYQRDALIDIAKNPRIVIAACHDLGKSWLMARVVIWFLVCFPFSKIVTTAPTYLQVKSILWGEIHAAYRKSLVPLGGVLNLTEWKIESDWFAIGFTPKNEAGQDQGTQSSFQGWHAPHILVIFDEATGIPKKIWDMAEGILTSASVKFVAIGNPTSKGSEFFRCFGRAAFKKIKLNCFDSPNLIANGITNIRRLEAEVEHCRGLSDDELQDRMANYKVIAPYLLSTAWVVERAMVWGFTHPLFVSKVLGEFPEEGENSIVSLGIVEEAQRRIYYPTPADRRCLGIDVARFGSDSTVFTYLHGYKFVARKVFNKQELTTLSGEAINFCLTHGWPDVITVDGTGLGSGLVDNLNEAKRERRIPYNVEVREVQFGAACEDPQAKEQYGNLKARMFDLLEKDLKAGLCLPNDAVYLDELPTILYFFDSKGRKLIESKDDYKKRTGRKSPDDADSLALANYGRYDEIGVGSFTPGTFSGSKGFAGSLGERKTW